MHGVKCAGHSGEATVRQIRNEFYKETTDARNSVHVSPARQTQPTQNYTVFVPTFWFHGLCVFASCRCVHWCPLRRWPVRWVIRVGFALGLCEAICTKNAPND